MMIKLSNPKPLTEHARAVRKAIKRHYKKHGNFTHVMLQRERRTRARKHRREINHAWLTDYVEGWSNGR